jgi:hypothetical protein
MSREIKKDILLRVKTHYVQRGRASRSRMIDDLCQDCDYERNYAIKLLGGQIGRLLRMEIPIRADNWNIARPGFLDSENVATDRGPGRRGWWLPWRAWRQGCRSRCWASTRTTEASY